MPDPTPLHPRPPAGDNAVRHYVFLLVEQFTHLAFSCAVEPLRLANYFADRDLYGWETMSVTGQPVRGSNGIALVADGDLRPLSRRETLVVVGGRMTQPDDPRLLAYLRRQAVHGTRIISICGGSSVLASAGILRNQPCAVHWAVSDAFAERHPGVEVVSRAFSVEGIATASGGAAAADLILHLIGQDHGAELAARVADLMVYPAPRGPAAPQTSAAQLRLRLQSRPLSEALRLMESHVEAPLASSELARRAGTSTRQLERLFRRHLGQTPHRHYLDLRMQKARQLVQETGLALADVAVACGFVSASHFSKLYRAHFGQSPHGDRRRPPLAAE